ncbi:MAG: hypothetical protein ABFD89_07000, partial [Bryobacteraceae bacterium]
MKKVSGLFVGTGAALTVAIGFIPDIVKVVNLTSATLESITWSKRMALAAVLGGLKQVSAGTISKLAYGAGISAYRGGVALTADSTSVLVADPAIDKRDAGTLGTVNGWVLGSAANRTGNFNHGVNTTYVGAGSKVCILDGAGRAKWYDIVAITNDGDAANEVTLSEAAPSGKVEALYGMYDFIGAKAGIVTPAGFTIDEATDINAAGEVC